MAPLSANAISHFTHPAHKLNQFTDNTSFLCDGCKVPGTGSRFTCTICSFDLHDYCAKCPSRVTTTTNHQHPLSLVVYKPNINQAQSCQICHNPVKGLAYHCRNCNFWVHPLCVSTNSRHSQDPSGSVPAAGVAGQSIGEQIAVGLATNYIYDQGKEHLGMGSNVSGGEDPSVESGKVPSNDNGEDHTANSGEDTSAGVYDAEEDGGGFFGFVKTGFKSMFESVSES